MNEYLLYVGHNKGTLIGVPARNLTEAEARQFNVDDLIKSGLYKLAKEEIKQDSEAEYLFETFKEDKPKRTYRRKE